MNFLRFIAISILISSCAVIQAPSGGPPDQKSPEILDFSPANYSKNFREKSIEIEFSEYLNRADVTKSVRINPPTKLSYDWSGKSLEIEFEEELKENTTYSIQIGTGYTDLAGNNPESSFELVFSTGNDLDSLQISGKVFSPKTEGLKVYLWKIDGQIKDTSSFIEEPDYISELGNNGNFRFGALKESSYRVLVFEDKNQNKKYDAGFEKFAVPIIDPKASNEPKEFQMKLSEANDISGPSLLSAFASSYESIDLNFSEIILKDELDIIISDSVEQTNSFQVRSFFFLDSIPGKKVRAITEKLPTGKALKINVVAKDTLGKNIIDSTAVNFFYVPDRELKKDKKISFGELKDSSKIKGVDFEYEINFPLPIRNESFDFARLINKEDSSNVRLDYYFLDSRSLSISANDLKPENEYKFEFDTKSLINIFNEPLQDTSVVINFSTRIKQTFSSISGSLSDSIDCENLILKIFNDKNQYFTKIENNKWLISEIIPGNYKTEIICDKNNNGTYDFGSVEPYEFSEKFYILKNEIEIKERWDLEDIILSQ